MHVPSSTIRVIIPGFLSRIQLQIFRQYEHVKDITLPEGDYKGNIIEVKLTKKLVLDVG